MTGMLFAFILYGGIKAPDHKLNVTGHYVWTSGNKSITRGTTYLRYILCMRTYNST